MARFVLFSPHQTGHVKRADRDRCDEKKCKQRLFIRSLSYRDDDVPSYKVHPQCEPDDKSNLKHSAEVDIFQPLMAKIEPHVSGKFVIDTQPFPRHRAEDDNQQRPEENVDTQPLPL